MQLWATGKSKRENDATRRKVEGEKWLIQKPLKLCIIYSQIIVVWEQVLQVRQDDPYGTGILLQLQLQTCINTIVEATTGQGIIVDEVH